MRQHTKEVIQYTTAVAMVASAITLAAVSFAMIVEIHSSVLVYASEALAYAAGIFGVSLYFRHKIGEIDEIINGRRSGEADRPPNDCGDRHSAEKTDDSITDKKAASR